MSRVVQLPTVVAGVLLLVAPMWAQAIPAADPVAEAIARRLAVAQVIVDGVELDGGSLQQVYAARHDAAAWRGANGAAVVQLLAGASADGLDPAAYHTNTIAAHAVPGDADSIATHDLLVTDAVLRWVTDMHRGVAPPRPSDESAIVPRSTDAVALTITAASASDPAAFLTGLAPRRPAYARLRGALEQYRRLAASGGWPPIPEGPSLHPGDTDPVIAAIRQRLVVTGELSVATDAVLYDGDLEGAVKAFQDRHGLAVDGVIGQATRAALATSVEDRIEQIVVNMERWRWMPDELGPRHVRVNIPSYTLEVVDDAHVVLVMPVVVGSATRRTPEFSSRITRLVFNPTWTVPAKLAKEDMLPKLRRNQQYFADHGIRVYASWGAGADEMDTEGIDWSAIGTRIAALKLRQEPGPGNPLGRVKFQIPNDYDVYLHDTNSKGLMRQARRALSSGCVRLGDALALADALLAGQTDWTPERRAEILADWDTRTVGVSQSVPVHLMYETAWVGDDGRVQFREDVYGRDRVLAKNLTAAQRRRRGASET
jgi:murein L,D-transpeptidase YcbB/YkuD